MKESIGIDVSMKSLDVAFFNGVSHRNLQYSNTIDGLNDLVTVVKERSATEIIITMEATGTYHLLAAVTLQKFGFKVSVVNPLIIKRYSEMKMLRAKTDAVDAKIIAEYGYNEKPSIFIGKGEEREHIVQLLKQLDALYRMQSENNNRLHAIKKIPDVNNTSLTVYSDIGEMLKFQEKKVKVAIQEIVKEAYPDQLRRMQTIPGVGNHVSSLIIGFFGRFDEFKTAKQVASYMGLNPSVKRSGISIKGRGVISKKGNPYMRKILFMAALSASKHNASCAALYERLAAKGKSKRLALIAVANKLVRQIFAVVKNNRIYLDNYENSISRA